MSSRLFRLCLAAFLACAPLLRAQNAATDFSTLPDDAVIPRVNIPDGDLDTILDLLELYTGRAILRPSTLTVPTTGGFNLVLDRPITKADLIRGIETVLRLNNIAVLPQDDTFMTVVNLQQARQETPMMINGSTLDMAPSGRIATKIFTLDFLTAAAFAQGIQGILNQSLGVNLVQLASANAIMVTDSISNLQRVEVLKNELDRPITGNLATKTYRLANAEAGATLTKIRTALSNTQQQQVGGQLSSDDRANQIILIGDPRIFPFYDDLIAKYDVVAAPNTRQEVIPLKSADAEELATLLQNLVTGVTAAAQQANQGGVQPGQGGAGGNQGGGAAAALPGTVAAAAPAAAPAAVAAAAPAGGNAGGGNAESGGSQQYSSLMTIVPDPRSNSIIVSGTIDDIRNIKEVIAQLDVLLPQVAIEVIIAEVTLNDSDVSGLSALNVTIGTDTANGTALPDGNGGTILQGTTDRGRGTHITSFSNLAVGGWNVTGGVVNPLSFVADLADAGSRNNVRVLQANTITTTHNREATFEVTQQQPIVTGTTSTTDGGTQSSTTYTDIGIIVTVTPLIGSDGSVQLTIDQIVDDVVGSVTIDDNVQPVVGHRQATSFVNVQDGEMVVLGGLRSNKQGNNRQKLGFIWEIPILSQILGGRTQNYDTSELLFFVRPHVIPAGATTAETEAKINELSNSEAVQKYLVDPGSPDAPDLREFIR